MATKKSLWGVLAYPSSSDLQKVLETLQGAGAQCAWCTHDADYKKDGTSADPHTHILCGWASNAPTWAKFVEILKSCGAVCPSDRGRYDPEAAKVHDPEKAVQYLEHTDQKSVAAGKHCYKGKAEFTDGWNVDDYITYAQKRATAKTIRADEMQERADDVSAIYQVIREHEFMEYFELADFVQSQMPDKFAALISNCYPIKSYLDSYRNSIALSLKTQLCKVETDLRNCNSALADARRKRDYYKSELKKLREFIAAKFAAETGENAPAWYDWTNDDLGDDD